MYVSVCVCVCESVFDNTCTKLQLTSHVHRGQLVEQHIPFLLSVTNNVFLCRHGLGHETRYLRTFFLSFFL